MFEKWIRVQKIEVVLEVFKRLTHHLSNSELVSVLEAINSGQEIVSAHIERGLLDKYRVDLFRIREIVTDQFPEEVID